MGRAAAGLAHATRGEAVAATSLEDPPHRAYLFGGALVWCVARATPGRGQSVCEHAMKGSERRKGELAARLRILRGRR